MVQGRGLDFQRIIKRFKSYLGKLGRNQKKKNKTHFSGSFLNWDISKH